MALLALVIDDSLLIRHTVGRFLQKRGFTVASASDGAEALEALQTLRPDLICTDLQMPRLSGHKLIDALQASSTSAHIPVLVLAGKPLPGDPPAPPAYSMIYKDGNLETQLGEAIASLFPAHQTT